MTNFLFSHSDNLIRVYTTDPEHIAAGVAPEIPDAVHPEIPDAVHLVTASIEMEETKSTSAEKAPSPGKMFRVGTTTDCPRRGLFKCRSAEVSKTAKLQTLGRESLERIYIAPL